MFGGVWGCLGVSGGVWGCLGVCGGVWGCLGVMVRVFRVFNLGVQGV